MVVVVEVVVVVVDAPVVVVVLAPVDVVVPEVVVVVVAGFTVVVVADGPIASHPAITIPNPIIETRARTETNNLPFFIIFPPFR